MRGGLETLTPDYIIVGAGSAGCILADGLSAGGRNKVTVLEAGPTDNHPLVRIPLGYGLLFNDRTRNYRYFSLPEPNLNGRSLYVPRGRTVGGSGSINALVYCRGLPGDYESWRQSGLEGWGWEDVRPCFEANERREGRHGGLTITDPARERHPFTALFLSAARELDLPRTTDFNDPSPEGVGFYHITTRAGRRDTSATAFLRPAVRQGRVRLETAAQVMQILFDGKRATGVVYRKGDATMTLRAAKAVVLAAGAIDSPRLLQVSGIGDPDHLGEIGVETRLENRNVGMGLQDHLFLGYQFRTDRPTLNAQLATSMALGWNVLRYLLTRRGPVSNSVNQFGGFVRSDAAQAEPDLQLYFNPASYSESRRAGAHGMRCDPFPGFTLGFSPTRPTSRGWVRAASSQLDDAPSIRLNALDTEKDRHDVVAGGRFIERTMRSKAISGTIAGALSPTPLGMSDDAILQDFRERSVSTYHPCCTCAMGTDPDISVVGPDLAVHGIERLYVADASVFPSIPSGNINAPTLMVARAAIPRILAS